jgi:hypothetical protein
LVKRGLAMPSGASSAVFCSGAFICGTFAPF